MSRAIVRDQTPEEREYARYQAEIEVREERAALLQSELEALKVRLAQFEAEYHARVGRLLIELDRARLAVDEYERRIAALRADPKVDPERVEEDLRTEFSGRREQLGEDEAENRRYEQAYERERTRPQLESGEREEAARLYRVLARRHHPDLARSSDERRRREPLMQQVNAAFREHDLAALRRLLQKTEANDPTFELRSLGEKLIWAIREVARLDDVINELTSELAIARSSDAYRLLARQEAGDDVIATLVADVQNELSDLRDRLAELIATYRHLLDRRME